MPSIKQMKKDITDMFPGENTYIYKLDTYGSIEFNVESWIHLNEYRLNAKTLYEELIALYISRNRDYDTFKWKIEVDATLTKILNNVKDRVIALTIECSDAKHARKTTFYNEIYSITKRLTEDSPVYEDFLNILEYHYSVTKTEPITSKNNDVHRSNIFGLLNLLRKKYGNGNPTNCTTTSSF